MSNSPSYKPKRYRITSGKKGEAGIYGATRKSALRRIASHIHLPRFMTLVKTGVALIFLGILFLGLAFAWYGRDLPNPEAIRELSGRESTKIMDRTGEHILYEIFQEKKRRLIALENLPDHVKWATISIEDHDFYTHPGFDLKGIVRGTVLKPITGKGVQGGSTITQQLVKNAILTPERTLTRKFKELILAILIERKFSKDEILQLYLNEIPYGSTAYGIEVAAQTFFEKPATDLTLDEAALLSALPKAPTYYSPHGNHTEELVGRQHYVLDQMVQYGNLTAEEADAAKKIDTLAKIVKPKQHITAPHFVFYIRELLIQELGERLVDEGGLIIKTSLDLDLQKKAEQAITDNEKKNAETWGASNAALVAIHPKTGEVLAMVGSKDYFNDDIDGKVNVATRLRQPGSSFKPIVYAASFEKGYTPDTVLHDVVTTFPSDVGPYTPHDYDGKERGPVTARTALAGSLNIPAVQMIYLTGLSRVLDLADELGYTTLRDRSRFGLSLVLGGGEVTLLEHTHTFATFGNDGISRSLLPVLTVTDSKGNMLIERTPDGGRRVLSEKSARELTSILTDNGARAYVFGANNSLTLPDRPVAAKTGTTNDYKDAWTMGFTPSLATGVWVGNNNATPMKRGADGSIVAAPIWNSFMRAALTGSPVESFQPAPPNDAWKPVLRGVGARGRKIKVDRISGKLATEWTPQETIEEREYILPHTILYYVNKDDPRGPAPTNPGQDPHFSSWERAVQVWIGKEKARAAQAGITIAFEDPPTEFDDIHTLESKPRIAIVAPEQNATVTSNRLEVRVDASGQRAIKEVRLAVDGTLIGTIYREPWETAVFLPASLTKGFHELEATVVDDIENHVTSSIAFSYDPRTLIDVELTRPQPGEAFTSSGGVSVTLLTTTPRTIAAITFYAERNEGETIAIARVAQPEREFTTFIWRGASPGAYRIWAEIDRADGTTIRTGATTISVHD
ncbi:MAG: PBP1A family penicillin-binding protein [bacterium]|nr:PBP1A family penicillin-binding protein [bacterium]